MSAVTPETQNARSIPIYEFLDKELLRNKWKKADFIDVSGIKKSSFYNVLSGNTKISRSIADKLSEHLGHSHDFWMRDEVLIGGGSNVVPMHTGAVPTAIATPAEGNAPQLLTDTMLRKAVENDLIALTNYHSVNQKSASYDLTLAPNVKMLSPRNGSEVDLVDCDFTMEHGDCVAAVTKETISLPPSYIARVGSTAELARQGIVVNTGLQIDPGYSGPMRFSIINMSGRPFALFTGQVVMSIEIFYLPVPPDKPFTKSPQGADLIGDLQNSIMSLFDVKKRSNGTSLVSLPRTGFEIRSEHVKRDDAVVEACSILARKLSSAAENSPLMAALSEIASDFTPSFDEVHGSLQSPGLLSLIQQAGVQMSELNLESLEERHETLRGILEQIEMPLNLFFAGVLSSGDLLE